MGFKLACITIFGIFVSLAKGQSCTWPPDLQLSGTWTDNSKGDIAFTTNTLTGWVIKVTAANPPQYYSNWQCFSNDLYTSESIIIARTQTSFVALNKTFYGYICLKIKKITTVSYRYYVNCPEQFGTNYERVCMTASANEANLTGLCLSSYNPSLFEYRVMIKSGSVAAAKIDCPYLFLGSYDYIYTNSSGSVSCDTPTDTWSTCQASTEMKFNYSTCPAKVANSIFNAVWCVDTVPFGGNNYVTVYNGYDVTSNINNVTIFLFSCFAISGGGTMATVAPSQCKKNQTPDTPPAGGASLTMTRLTTCLTCPALTAPDRGSLSISTDGAVTTASYNCSASYTLTGSSTRVCQSNRTWSGTTPRCACPTPVTPANGTATVSSNGLTATFTCNKSFVLVGASSLTCNTATNDWIGTEPTCDLCQALTAPTNGTYNVTSTGLTSVVTYTCNVGTTLNGVTSRTCKTDKTWNATTPTCASCPGLSNISSGNVSVSTSGVVTSAVYVCATGYTLYGKNVTTCQSSGTWDFQPPTCACNAPVSPANGTANVSADRTEVVYTCLVGFTLSGTSIRTCKTDGTGWTNTNPVCVGCPGLTTPSNGSVALSTNGTLTIANYTCGVGFTINGSMTSQCKTNGLWSSPKPLCTRCDNLPAVTSRNFSLVTDGSTTYAQFTCAVGTTISGAVTVSCDGSGHWSTSSSNTTCVKCPDLSPVTGGQYSVSSNGTTSTAQMSCASGYTLTGTPTIQCLSNGSWTRAQSMCACPNPVTPLNGTATVSTSGLSANFTCRKWFVLVGESTLICNGTTNTWIGSEPTCEQCQPLSAPTNGTYNVTSTDLTSVVTYSCNVGTTLNGVTSRTCKTDKSWNATTPTCTSCTGLTNISSGYVTLSTSGTVTSAMYSCAAGYTLIGSNFTTCQATGELDSQPPTCVCNIPKSPGNGNVTVSSNGSQVVYTCALGFTLSGVSTRTCMTNGSGWSNTDPVCVSCSGLSAPSNGNVSLSTNGTVTSAAYACAVGFTLNGSLTSQCKANGQLSVPKPSCARCDSLPVVTSGNYTLATDGSMTSAEYTCDVGATISGNISVTCNANGHWSTGSSNTRCVKCSDLSSVTGGQYSVSSNGTTSTAQLSCASGYTLTGTSTIQCLSNGSWSQTQSTCVSASASTAAADDKGGSGLLPAVIVLAILVGLLAVTFGGVMFYIKKIKKNMTENKKSKSHGGPGYMFPASMAPVDHKQHMLDGRHTSLSMTSSANHHPAPAPSRMDSMTPRTPKSVFSFGNMHLDLVRETTNSVIFSPGNPAPWSKKPPKESDTFELGKTNGDGGVDPTNGTAKVPSTKGKTNKGQKKKKHSFGKKMKIHHSVNSSGDHKQSRNHNRYSPMEHIRI